VTAATSPSRRYYTCNEKVGARRAPCVRHCMVFLRQRSGYSTKSQTDFAVVTASISPSRRYHTQSKKTEARRAPHMGSFTVFLRQSNGCCTRSRADFTAVTASSTPFKRYHTRRKPSEARRTPQILIHSIIQGGKYFECNRVVSKRVLKRIFASFSRHPQLLIVSKNA
jgi:hypothetical protein